MDKILTISIAAYNVEKFIAKAIKSCLISNGLAQIEILVVNDGSADNTQSICEDFANQYSDSVRLINKENGGYGSTVNRAICEARGKYFRLLDGDDWFDTDSLEKYVSFLLKTDADMVLSDFMRIYSTEKSQTCHLELKNDCILTCNEIYDTDLFMPSICYKTQILKECKLRITEHCFYTDMEYVILPLQYVRSIIYFPFSLYMYRLDNQEQSVSSAGIRKHYRDSYVVLKKLLEKYQDSQEVNLLYRHQITGFAKKVIGNYLFVSPYKVKEQLIEIDGMIRRCSEDIYELTYNKMIFILRMSHYHLWWLCVIVYRIKIGMR